MSMNRSGRFEGWLDAKTYALWRENDAVFIRLDIPVDPARVFPARSGWYGSACNHFPPVR
jgi:hypothetical protein